MQSFIQLLQMGHIFVLTRSIGARKQICYRPMVIRRGLGGSLDHLKIRRLIWNLLISVDPPAVLGKPEWHYELTLTLLEAPSSIVMDIMVMVSRPPVEHLV